MDGKDEAGDHLRGKHQLLLADDHQDVLSETRSLLAPHFEIVGTVCDGLELLIAARKLRPEVVITDAHMPRLGGIDAGRLLLRTKTVRAVILLTVDGDPELVQSALAAGITGCVLKVNAGEELLSAIDTVLHGGTFISRELAH